MSIKLKDIDTDAPKGVDKAILLAETSRMAERIAELQNLMHAEGKHSLLLVLQGMDGSGKDGTTKAVIGACSPIGVNTFSFKKPTDEEFAHDFLWRVHQVTPRKGTIQVFIRSHYEDILIQRVHNWIDAERVKVRMKAINAFEELLEKDNNTLIIKCFLHISMEKQEEILQERIDDPKKHWKHNDADWEERKLWSDYQKAYEDIFENCDKPAWHIIPADQKWYRNYAVAKLVLEKLESLDMKYPPLVSKM